MGLSDQDILDITREFYVTMTAAQVGAHWLLAHQLATHPTRSVSVLRVKRESSDTLTCDLSSIPSVLSIGY